MSKWIDAEWLMNFFVDIPNNFTLTIGNLRATVNEAPSIDIVRCENCRKSHIDGKTTHYLWCTEWGRSTDTFGYCERGEREGE